MDRFAHANEWIRHAQADYDAVMHLKTQRLTFIKIICFHCQQTAEKALKAILAYYDEEIPRTHDLMHILEFCEFHCNGILAKFSDEADQLSGFAVVTRYPNEVEVTEADMFLAITGAEQILEYAKSLLRR